MFLNLHDDICKRGCPDGQFGEEKAYADARAAVSSTEGGSEGDDGSRRFLSTKPNMSKRLTAAQRAHKRLLEFDYQENLPDGYTLYSVTWQDGTVVHYPLNPDGKIDLDECTRSSEAYLRYNADTRPDGLTDEEWS